MPKFIKTWHHLVPGDKYKRQFNLGEECPKECVEAAAKDGAIEAPEKPAAKRRARGAKQ